METNMGLFSRKKSKDEHRTVAPNVSSGLLLSYQTANLQGIGTRAQQEDSFGFVNVLDVTKIREKGLLAIVADGMGGMKGGKAASDTAVASIREDFEKFDYSGDLAQQLRNSVDNANERIYDMLDGAGGTTLISCLFYREKLYFACVGDSYLYLKRGNHLYSLNRKHSVLYDEFLRTIRNSDFDPSVARENEEKHALSCFLGMEMLDDIDYLRRPLKLLGGDILLLCSDGVGGVLSEEGVISCLNMPVAKDMCSELEKEILKQNLKYQDNYTALVIKCEY